ncbi:MAG: hypothetical protein HQL07_00475 [Nitrospirae bacterium]|nr:hypothetical protein [Magnetococcales bacterium]
MLVRQSEWARRQGFSRQYVSELIKKGVIKLVDGRIDEAQAKRGLDSIRDPARGPKRKLTPTQPVPPVSPSPPVPPASTMSLDIPSAPPGDLPTKLLIARIRTEVKKGGLLDIKEKKELETLLDAQEVRKEALARGREFRALLENWASGVYRAMAAELEVDERKMRIVLERFVRELLTEIAGSQSSEDGDG